MEANNFYQTRIPTFEEFSELVRKEYVGMSLVVAEEDANKYFYCEEAQDHVKSEYMAAAEEYESGEIGVGCFWVGYVSRVAYCLYMMFEYIYD